MELPADLAMVGGGGGSRLTGTFPLKQQHTGAPGESSRKHLEGER